MPKLKSASLFALCLLLSLSLTAAAGAKGETLLGWAKKFRASVAQFDSFMDEASTGKVSFPQLAKTCAAKQAELKTQAAELKGIPDESHARAKELYGQEAASRIQMIELVRAKAAAGTGPTPADGQRMMDLSLKAAKAGKEADHLIGLSK